MPNLIHSLDAASLSLLVEFLKIEIGDDEIFNFFSREMT